MLKKGVTIVIYCFIILSFIILVLPENTKAVYTPIIHLEWAEGQEVQFADVEPGELNYVIFSGTIGSYRRRCSMIYDIYVELKGSTDMGWPVNITPSFFHLYGWNERAFSVIVELIPGLNINTTGNLFVYGNGTVYPGGNSCHVVPITGTIKINKYNQ